MTLPLSGPAFPFRVVNGAVSRAHGFEKVEDDVRHLLSTRLGERLMLRGYGGGVHHRLHMPNDATLHAVVKHEIQQALRTFLPEVRLAGPIRVGGGGEKLRISLDYTADPRDIVRRVELELP